MSTSLGTGFHRDEPVKPSFQVATVTLTVSASSRRRCWRFPVTTVTPHPAVWRRALELAGGDHRRLTVQRDGSVIVSNP
jgi:hypothetical protein